MPISETNELSERELDILKLVATGASNKEIAQKLFISANTVKVHLRNIFAKIGVASRTEAAMYAVRVGMVETEMAQILAQNASSQNKDNSGLPFDPTITLNHISDVQNNKKMLYVRYIGLFGVIFIILAIFAIIYLRSKLISTEALTQPTPTTRVQWFELPGLPTPRRGLAVGNFENQIYAIGGESIEGICNITESYDPQKNKWSLLASKPTSVTDISAAVIGGLIYVPGGRLASGIPTNITEIYDPRSNQWSTGSPLPNPLSAYALTVFEGRIYIFGGWNGNQVVNDTYVYDPHNQLWSELPEMPTARSFAGSVAVGGKIYVIGGWNGNQALMVNEVYLPDLSGGGSRWVQASRLPSGRYGMGIANLADIIFLIGGKGSDDSLTTIALVPGDLNWGQIEAPIQNDLSFLGAVTVGTRLFAIGGIINDELNTQMWSYQAIFTITLPIIR